MIPSALKGLKGINLDDTVSTVDNLSSLDGIHPQRMAGQAFSGLKKGQGLAALLGLVETGLKHSGTSYGNKVRAARQELNDVKDSVAEFGLSKLGL